MRAPPHTDLTMRPADHGGSATPLNADAASHGTAGTASTAFAGQVAVADRRDVCRSVAVALQLQTAASLWAALPLSSARYGVAVGCGAFSLVQPLASPLACRAPGMSSAAAGSESPTVVRQCGVIHQALTSGTQVRHASWRAECGGTDGTRRGHPHVTDG